ncbi:zn-finger in ran binding protein and others domain-containing protein [Cystoisospora suis]|uniref:Zn-finger in ran binding protein and others domain-containing protein n=1 Tax=Cystoisospora suis TaxID=483139 RepID=A0A2C6KHE7_9APIC|nr:zn-finger in ran binding protein and others domain-containing protein [Cystoisospora suis]
MRTPPDEQEAAMASVAREVAQKTVLTLVEEFISQGDEAPADRAAQVLKLALVFCEASGANSRRAEPADPAPASCSTSCTPGVACSSASDTSHAAEPPQRPPPPLGGGAHFAAPRVLVAPDKLKNPSSFLKIYGDPLCFAGSRNLVAGYRGNWKCAKCGTVNFPRRFRCKQCDTERDSEGDQVVFEYATSVYKQYVAQGVWPEDPGDTVDIIQPATLYASPRACRRLRHMGGGRHQRSRGRRRGGQDTRNNSSTQGALEESAAPQGQGFSKGFRTGAVSSCDVREPRRRVAPSEGCIVGATEEYSGRDEVEEHLSPRFAAMLQADLCHVYNGAVEWEQREGGCTPCIGDSSSVRESVRRRDPVIR